MKIPYCLALFVIYASPLLLSDIARSGENPDWLITEVTAPVAFTPNAEGTELTLSNGLLRRTFLTEPNLATIGFKHLVTEHEMVRGVKPEAVLEIDGRRCEVGGLRGQPDYAFFKPEWAASLTASPDSFQFVRYDVEEIAAPIPWNRKRHAADLPWPPKGKSLVFQFRPPEDAEALRGIEAAVHYDVYEGLPALCKWITVTNRTDHAVVIGSVTTELLAMVERESDVERTLTTKPRAASKRLEYNDLAEMTRPLLHVQSDYSFCGMSYKSADQTTFWLPDPDYETQVNYTRQWPHLVTSRYPYGPAAAIQPGETFTTFRTYELLFDSDDAERRGLSIRRLQRAIAPWATENPLMLHLRYSDSESIRRAVDQCVETGFEMIILSFGSGVNMESEDEAYLARLKEDFDYAHERGIEIGAYSLLSSRDEGPENNVLNPETGKPGAYFGQAPCLASEWGDRYFRRLTHFIEATGCDVLEHDGSYPGDPCMSTQHNGHQGLEDSQWQQHRRITNLYRWCRERGVYLNVPDYYILSGSNKTGMGYRETNWSLPRPLQILHSRQNVYDGTWTKSPSMGWMFVPLVEYHGGGEAATLEPLSEHLDTYEAFLAQNLGSGVQACYRGPRLYDTETTRDLVRRWVTFYKQYRTVLDSDIVHLRRPDGRDWDGILHVNPNEDVRGLAWFFNPTDRPIERTVNLPLYYTGIQSKAVVASQDQNPITYMPNRSYEIPLEVRIPAGGWAWYTVRAEE